MNKSTDPLRISLVVSTYNWPEALRECLKSTAKQTLLPYEVLIADDGSKEPTRKFIEEFSLSASFPVKHVWHEDRGFRVSAIRNKALAIAEGDYIVYTDGDIILDKNFLYDHARLARRGFFSAGSRVDLPPGYTEKITSTGRYCNARMRLIGLNSILKGVRIPALAPKMTGWHADNPLLGRSCNMAAWRDDLLAVNGFDESYEGWGREDTDLICRLMKFGLKKQTLRLCARSWHLYHKVRSNDKDLARNDALLRQARARDGYRCANGVVKDSAPGSPAAQA